MKIVAMFGVICLHCNVHYQSYILASLLFKCAVVSIPLFFMVSGYLMASKQVLDADYCLKKIKGILKFTIGFSLIVYLMHAFNHKTFGMLSMMEQTLGSLLQKGRMGIFWYFGAMIFIYAMLPMLQKKIVRKKLSVLIKIGGVVLITVFFLNVFVGIKLGQPFESFIIQSFRLWNWLFYFLLGFYWRQNENVVKRNGIIWILALLFVCNYLQQVFLNPYMSTMLCEFYYSSPIVILTVGIIFEKIKAIHISSNGKIYRLIREFSSLFLPVYAFHMFVISYSHSLIDSIYFYCGNLSPLIVCMYVSMVSLIISFAVMRIPIINRFLKI